MHFFEQRYSMKRKFIIWRGKTKNEISTLPVLSSIVLRIQRWGPFPAWPLCCLLPDSPPECTLKANVDHTHTRARAPPFFLTHPLPSRSRRNVGHGAAPFSTRAAFASIVFWIVFQCAKPGCTDVSLTGKLKPGSESCSHII